MFVLFNNAAMAVTVPYTFQAPVYLETRNNFEATPDQRFFSDGDMISGTFNYDSGVVSGSPGPNGGTFYPAFSDLSGTIEGNEFSDPDGEVGVFNDSFSIDMLDLLLMRADSANLPANLSGFQVVNGATTFELYNVRLFWIEDTTDLYDDETLPVMLPPGSGAIARVALDFRDVTNSDNIHRVSGDPLVVSAVPVPAAVWLFGSGLLGLIGISRSKIAAQY